MFVLQCLYRSLAGCWKERCVPRSSTEKRSSGRNSTARVGMPAPAAVLSEGTLRSPKGKVYRIIRTNEVDAGEPKPPPSAVVGVGMMAAGPVGDDFMGSDRKAAKLSISAAEKEKFDDLADLIQSLPAISAMKAHQPVIKLDPTSGRVQEEERNVTLKAFLYAASREADNDIHLIVGRDPHTAPPLYLTM